MQAILQNPIWHAANTGNLSLTRGNEHVRTFDRDVAIFSGMKENNDFHLGLLHQLLNQNEESILFCDREINVDSRWNLEFRDGLHMMVFPEKSFIPSQDKLIKPLVDKNIPQMKALCELTKPGPFFDRTISFGNYKGIFSDDQLIAMAGYRLQPQGYIEISAVCTHPNHLGHGYATRLIKSLMVDILALKQIPFLHVLPTNPALKLYHKIGFVTAEILEVFILRKQ